MTLLNEVTHSSVAVSISFGSAAVLIVEKSATGMFTDPGSTLWWDGIVTAAAAILQDLS